MKLREFFVVFTDFSRHRDGTGKAYDFALMKELEETRKVVQEAKRAFQSNRGSGIIVLTVNMNLLCFSLFAWVYM